MFQYKNLDNYLYFFIYIFPISLLVGVFFLNLNSALISLFFLVYVFKNNKIEVINNQKYYFFYLVLILFFLTSIFSKYKFQSFENLISFFSYILMFVCLVFFLNTNKKNSIKLSKIVFIIVLIICVDLWIQRILGTNILGFPQQQAGRLTSFFKDEQIPGGILFKLSPFYIYFLFKQKNNFFYKFKFLFILFLYFSILITGERLASILSTFALLLIPLVNYKKIKSTNLLIYFTVFIFVFIPLYLQSDSIIKERITYTFLQFENNIYFHMFNNAYEIFKDNFLLGTGLQTYRYECPILYQNCSTHPHNFFMELLSDTGIFSAMIFYFGLIYLFFSKIKNSKSFFEKSIIFTFTLLLFFPFLPSGSFFNSYGMNLTWFSLGFIYSLKDDL